MSVLRYINKEEKKWVNHGQETGIYQKKFLVYSLASSLTKISSIVGHRDSQTQKIEEKWE